MRIAYSSLRMITTSIESPSRAAVQIDWTEYWNEPSPMTAMTGRSRPESRSASAIPTEAGKVPAQPSAGKGVERVWLGDRPCRMQVGQIRGALLDQDGVIRPDLVERREHFAADSKPSGDPFAAIAGCGAIRLTSGACGFVGGGV